MARETEKMKAMEDRELLPPRDSLSQQLHCLSSSFPLPPHNTFDSSLASLDSLQPSPPDRHLSLSLSDSSFPHTLASTFSSPPSASLFFDSLSQIGASEALSWECTEQFDCTICDSSEGSECSLRWNIPDDSSLLETNVDSSPSTLQDAVHCERPCRRDCFLDLELAYATVPIPTEAPIPSKKLGNFPNSEPAELYNSALAETSDLGAGNRHLHLHGLHRNWHLVSQKNMSCKNSALAEAPSSASTTLFQQKKAPIITEIGKVALPKTGSPLRELEENATIVTESGVTDAMPYHHKGAVIAEIGTTGKENVVQMEDYANRSEDLRLYKQTTLSRLQNFQHLLKAREQAYTRLGATVADPNGWLCPRAAKKNFKAKPRQFLLDNWLAKQR